MKLLYLSLFFLALQTLLPHKLSQALTPRLIIWNVGQGQWVTYIKNNHCYHMDMGGEFAPINEVLKKCKNKENWIYISHADKDHINFYKRYTRKVNSHCLAHLNKNFLNSTDLQKKQINLCSKTKHSPIKTIYSPNFKLTKNRNELSKVFIVENKILNPGDSLNQNELYWAQKKSLKSITVLILGHHGSLTSNSNYLLSKLPKLKFSAVSARKNRYGHPHGRIGLRLKANNTPVISTEQWSHITILL